MQKLLTTACFLLALVAAGCGGGGDSSADSPAPTPPPVEQNIAPQAHAGTDQNVLIGTVVTLDGSASSDANGDALTYRWTLTARPEGSTATLSSDTEVRPTFTADLAGSYAATLVVSDGQLESTTAQVTVTASASNAPPVADAGNNQQVLVNTSVTLDGSASSDANGDALTYLWALTERPQGSTATLSSPTEVRPTFTADLAGTYVATLIVHDGQLDSAAAQVTVTASASNAAPVARAGTDQNVLIGTPVTLDGSASSDADGDALTYLWAWTSRPQGSVAALAGSTQVQASFTPDVAGSYVATLIVNDGLRDSAPSQVTVTATGATNAAPIANAGDDQTVNLGTSVTLDGSASSDANGDALSYLWTLTSRPQGSTAALASPTEVRPTFTPDVAGSYVATLVVNDGQIDSAAATVTVTALSAASLSLYSTGDWFSGDRLLSFPYSISSTQARSCIGCTSIDVANFKLVATGASYTITNLSAVNRTSGSTVTASFDGLRNGQVIASGQTVEFSLRSTFTRNQPVNLSYSFTIQETGQRFTYNVQLTSN